MTRKKLKNDPQVVVPRWVHEILTEKSAESGKKLKSLTEDVLIAGLRVKRWMPEAEQAAA